MTQRPQDVTRRVIIDLKKVEERIPRNDSGDPSFTHLQKRGHRTDVTLEHQLEGLQDVFTDDQIVALVNRALYQMEYSRKIHRERSQAERDRDKPIKEAFKRLFPTTSWANATEEQIKDAVQVVYSAAPNPEKGDQ